MTETDVKQKRKRRGGKSFDLESRPATETRRKDKAQDDEWITNFIKSAPLGYFGLRWDDQPFVYPMTFWYDEDRHCLYIHGSFVGRRGANSERHQKVSFTAADMGALLPSNQALHFSSQFRAVMAFGEIERLTEEGEMKHALYGLIDKYFTPMKLGQEYSPITEIDLKQTGVYRINIKSWSGKNSMKEKTDQNKGWPELEEKWFKKDAFPMSQGKFLET